MSFSKDEYRNVVYEAAFDNEQALASGTFHTTGGGSSDDEFTTASRDRDASDESYFIFRNMKEHCEKNSLLLLEKMELGNLIQFLRS